MRAKLNKFSYISKLLSFKNKLGGDFLSLPCKLSDKRKVFATHRSRVVGYALLEWKSSVFDDCLKQSMQGYVPTGLSVFSEFLLISTILMSASVGRGMSLGTKLLRTTINTSLPLAIAVISNS